VNSAKALHHISFQKNPSPQKPLRGKNCGVLRPQRPRTRSQEAQPKNSLCGERHPLKIDSRRVRDSLLFSMLFVLIVASLVGCRRTKRKRKKGKRSAAWCGTTPPARLRDAAGNARQRQASIREHGLIASFDV
jgi:hypothetical protein